MTAASACPKCRMPIPGDAEIMDPTGPGPFPAFCWNGRVTELALRPEERQLPLAARQRILEWMERFGRGQCYDLERHRQQR